MPDCPFCTLDPARIIGECTLTLTLWDGFPVSPGHALIIPRRHLPSWSGATVDEKQALISAIDDARELIDGLHGPNGYNIGFNDGRAAGQTVMHLHMHVIPRYDGDVPDPRGGVRWVMPSRARYWDSEPW
jgi:diadenosine tetraphosphate (Ap4A) HIT family hydrolase